MCKFSSNLIQACFVMDHNKLITYHQGVSSKLQLQNPQKKQHSQPHFFDNPKFIRIYSIEY
jgi:hypothetical protein